MSKKAISWLIRVAVLVILYVVFWNKPFVKESLYFVVPLLTISFLVVFLLPKYRKRKK